jgi:DNA-directed RNA polymerase subunit RPC12/RpoP
MSDEYKCIQCNKQYTNRTGLWKHNKKYHEIVETKLTESNKNVSICNDNVSKCNKNITENLQSSKYNCKSCKKQFNSRQTKWRHEKTCKLKSDEKQEIELLKNMINEMDKKIKLLEKSKSSNKNINNGNIYNGKTINNITINALGHEMVTLTKEDVEAICNKNIKAVLTFVEKTNFDKDRKYNHNFCTTNQNGKYLLHYDQETSSIKSAKKKYFYQEVISNAINKIETSYNNHKSKFIRSKQIHMEDIISRLKAIKDYDFNNKLLKSLFDELNLLCYNHRDIILDTWATCNITNELEIDENCKDIFIPVQECLKIYNNESENESDSESAKLILPKKKSIEV